MIDMSVELNVRSFLSHGIKKGVIPSVRNYRSRGSRASTVIFHGTGNASRREPTCVDATEGEVGHNVMSCVLRTRRAGAESRGNTPDRPRLAPPTCPFWTGSARQRKEGVM